MWQAYQQLRLAQERLALEQQLPNFTLHNPIMGTYVAGWWMSNTDQWYHIQLHLPLAYPDAAPDTYVTHPSPLYGYNKPIESYGSSHEMHTWATDRPGWGKVGIVRPEYWSAAYSIVKVLRKAMLWITAYECHLDDGQSIAKFLI